MHLQYRMRRVAGIAILIGALTVAAALIVDFSGIAMAASIAILVAGITQIFSEYLVMSPRSGGLPKLLLRTTLHYSRSRRYRMGRASDSGANASVVSCLVRARVERDDAAPRVTASHHMA
jgi:hypothetical protein